MKRFDLMTAPASQGGLREDSISRRTECLAWGLVPGRTPRVEATIWNSGFVCLYSFKMNSFKNM